MIIQDMTGNIHVQMVAWIKSTVWSDPFILVMSSNPTINPVCQEQDEFNIHEHSELGSETQPERSPWTTKHQSAVRSLPEEKCGMKSTLCTLPFFQDPGGACSLHWGSQKEGCLSPHRSVAVEDHKDGHKDLSLSFAASPTGLTIVLDVPLSTSRSTC